jgi:uncharacterized protein (DUF58 family)
MKQSAFALVWASMAAAALIVGGRAAYQLFYIASVIFALAVFYMLGVFFLVRIQSRAEDEFAVSGEKTAILTRIENNFLMPIPSVILNFTKNLSVDIPSVAATSVLSRRTKILKCDATFACRGRYRIGVSSWQADDYLGLFSVKRRVARLAEVAVLPRVVNVDEHPPLPPPELEDNSQNSYGTELSGARPYINSDGMRHIHWKLSAKGDDLYVRQFSGIRRPPTWVVTDMTEVWHAKKEAVEDKLLETSLSITRHLLGSFSVNTAAVTGEVETKTLKTMREFHDYYQNIGLEEFSGMDFGGKLVSTDFGGEGIIWLVTSTSDITGEIGELLMQGWIVKWLYVSFEDDSPEQLTEAERMGAQVLHVSLENTAADAAWMFQ